MPLDLAQDHAWDLARTLMVCTIVHQVGEDAFAVTESREFDGDVESVVREYDPYA
jgi:hypothetical protein